ncbi:unnamed protein product [Protopolystoma xenopodis]|uniref:Uncharacterized protein n=1 Tax=Protopolystoma xenopodis TaxID=117903 RepID=A0A3S5CMN1_9PLAT|nr:unnamed protein product [Protopolystoma xenopodis]
MTHIVPFLLIFFNFSFLHTLSLPLFKLASNGIANAPTLDRLNSGFTGSLCQYLTSVHLPNQHSYVAVKPFSPGIFVPQGNITLLLSTGHPEGVILYLTDTSVTRPSVVAAMSPGLPSVATLHSGARPDNDRYLVIDLYQGHVRVGYSLGSQPGSEGYSSSVVSKRELMSALISKVFCLQRINLYLPISYLIFHCLSLTNTVSIILRH